MTIKAPSSDVVHCVHAERCGGCAFIGQPMAAQLARKQESVQRELAAYPCLQRIEVKPTERARPMVGYRTRAKLIVSADGGIGLYARGSHAVVDIPECQVMDPALVEVVAEVRTVLAEGLQPSAAVDVALQPRAALTGLDARVVHAPGEPAGVLLTLAGAPESRQQLEPLAGVLARHPRVRGVALRWQAADAVQQLEGTLEPFAGDAVVRDTLRDDGPFHYATFGSFVQAHRGQAAALAEQACSLLEGALGSLREQRVLELFSGAGALGLELASRGAHVTLVERYAPALTHAQRAAREQRLQSLAAISGDAEPVVQELAARGEHYDAVLVNPPRRGLRPGLRARIAALAPRAIVYVSCEPSTLARDLADFAFCGFAADSVQPFDMIPLSVGVESVLLLTPRAPAPIAVLHEDEELLVVDKPPHLSTTPDAAHDSSLLTRLQREHGLPELSAVHRLDIGTSGICLFAKERRHVAALAERLQAGEKHYLTLVRGAIRPKGVIRVALREQHKTRPATSRYNRVARAGTHSLVRVRPEQGRTHQVRKHMAAIKHPVLGDERYGDAPSNRHFEHRHGLDRTFLHAARLLLPAHGGKPALTLEAPLAPDLAAVLSSLREASPG